VIGLLQRVSSAQVVANGATTGSIDAGLLVLIGIERGDTQIQADRLLQRLLGYRVFPDCNGKMNDSLHDIGGGLLLVPQFTLAADTDKGMRPSFSHAATPELAQQLFDYLCEQARQRHSVVETGVFGADMEVGLLNDGPVTFWLRVRPD